jgi:competence protein ComFC
MFSQILNKSKSIIQSAYDDFKEFLSPSVCICCGKDRDFDDPLFCLDCIAALKRKNIGDGPVCPFCGRPKGTLTSCDRCKSGQAPDLFFWGYYQEELQECLLQFKFHSALDLGRRLTDMAIESLLERLRKYDVVIPVPLHQTRERERRYNQSEIIARRIAELLNISLAVDYLVRPRATKQQAKLPEKERWNNVKNAFVVNDKSKPLITGKYILLVDDIVTTGATVSEASKPLLNAGARKIDILSLSYAK